MRSLAAAPLAAGDRCCPRCTVDLARALPDAACAACGAPPAPDRGWMWACGPCEARFCWGCAATVRQQEAPERGRAARAPCDHCGQARKGKPANRPDHRRGCHHCPAGLAHREWCYTCEACGNAICQSCATPSVRALRLAPPSLHAIMDTQATDGTVDNYSGQPPNTAMIDEFLVSEREQAEEAAGRSALLALLRTAVDL